LAEDSRREVLLATAEVSAAMLNERRRRNHA
jgi:hypothetical protein